jgi:hypothetical protein
MSFLNGNNSEYLSARITQKGRNAISKGNFKISYFQIGDSEFDYDSSILNMRSQNNYQKVISPVDKESGVKYPYKMDIDSNNTYGIPIENSTIEIVRNVMGPAGFVSEYQEYDQSCDGTSIKCETQMIPLSGITGTNTLTVLNGSSYNGCEYISLVLGNFCGTNQPIISGLYNSYTYKILSISGNTLTLDRVTPNLSTLSGHTEVVCNKCEVEYPLSSEVSEVCSPNKIDSSDQQNPWTLNIVWDTKPLGSDVTDIDEGLSGFTSNYHMSTKEFFGYNSTGQTFENFTGGTISDFSSKMIGTSFKNSFNETIEVKPSEQRCIAVIHYSELGDLINDPERFYKYDDYISHKTGIVGDDIAITFDRDDNPISDTEYFEVYIPFVLYHRSDGSKFGALFTMDTTNYYIRPSSGITQSRFELLYRYLLDENGNKVGKVFPTKKVVIFDDQEIVAMLDYRSNRKFTLDAPKISIVNSDTTTNNSLISGLVPETYWVTYMLANQTYNNPSALNYLPCNYFIKVTSSVDENQCSINIPSNIGLKFGSPCFRHMKQSFNDIKTGFLAKQFVILIQKVNSINDLPTPNMWVPIPMSVPTNNEGHIIPSGLTNTTFIITKTMYEQNLSNKFDLESAMGNDYLWSLTGNTNNPQFGDVQPFPGSIRLIRSTDIQEMNFLINLPCNQFEITQNPTYQTGDKYITEISLLNDNKEPLVVAKTSIPIKRLGTQVFTVKLDF